MYTFFLSEPYVTEDELKLMLRGAELSGAIAEDEQVRQSSIWRCPYIVLHISFFILYVSVYLTARFCYPVQSAQAFTYNLYHIES